MVNLTLFCAAYLKAPESSLHSSSEWLIASVILAVFLALLLIWVLFLVYKQYWVSRETQLTILAMTAWHLAVSVPKYSYVQSYL